MKLPRSIRIGLVDYKILVTRKGMRSNCLGLCEPAIKVIRIRPLRRPYEMYKTLIHEVFHAFEFEYGIPIPHKLIDLLEVPMLFLIRDNPKLILEIKNALFPGAVLDRRF